jgi:uncharacterized protein
MVFLSFLLTMCLTIVARRLVGTELSADAFTLLTVVISLFCVQGLAVVWVHIFIKLNNTTWGEAFGVAQRNFGHALAIALLALPLVLIGMALFTALSSALLNILAGSLGYDWLKPQPQVIVELLRKDWPMWLLILQGFGAIVLAPVGEELIFRGVLYGFFKQRGYARLGLWITSVLFAVVHGNLAGFVFFIFMAFVLVAIYERTKNLFAPILLHSLFNSFGFIMIVTNPKWAQKLIDQ